MRTHFYSVYGPLMKQFIDLKRSAGYKYVDVEHDCARFDKFAADRNEINISITKELAEAFGKKRANESDKTRYNRIQTIRTFSAYLANLGYSSFIPQLPPLKSTFTPYIFSKEEMKRFFAVCDNLQPTRNHLGSMVFIMPCLFRILYGTGIRIGEAMALRCEDVNLIEKHLVIHDSKNGKDRLVPISDSLAQVCSDYFTYSQQLRSNECKSAFFVSPSGGSFHYKVPHNWFKRILYKADIPYSGRSIGPRLHDLRHTFSVHSLADMAEAGTDLYYSLPVLSAYLGHQSVTATDRYVRLTTDMFPSIMKQLSELHPYLIRDIYQEKSYEAN